MVAKEKLVVVVGTMATASTCAAMTLSLAVSEPQFQGARPLPRRQLPQPVGHAVPRRRFANIFNRGF